MSIYSLTGKDTIQINNRILTQFGDGDVVTITAPNNFVEMKVGKNGNAVYAFNESGRMMEVQLRILRGGSDDIYLNGLLNSMKNDLPSFSLLSAQFTKRVGDGQGGVVGDKYNLSGGVFLKSVEGKENNAGDTEQAISIYTIQFANNDRAIG